MYISKKSITDGVSFEGEAVVLGETVIGKGSVIGFYSVIGYPTLPKVRGKEVNMEEYDRLSEGARIGEGCFIRSHSVIYERATLGNGIQTGHSVLIREDSIIGDRTLIGTHSIVDGRVKIGREVSIQSGVYIPPMSEVGDRVFLAPFVVITNDKYPPSRRLLGVKIENDAVIGANSVLVSGVRIGEGAVVASGAVVTRDVPPRKVVMGVPARVVGTREEYDEKKREYEGI
ncbi:N-acetyltransferase [Candidatus Korarchaeum cryptofilum]|jgi:acetyltransferase-like isoleucine patch superfamily enzyme|uniref:N-acetyltransferase n=1 Tax=Candidatus Korarchaeum cryptofilum TaxID=498846 RepID=A0A3R9RJ07_9CREN|nr:acyltransferase [Candidatus Korarchaeum cryptofilum]RSN69606.1 N-acetyltransferase [Candidatus Korarchaeum cryptofilum]